MVLTACSDVNHTASDNNTIVFVARNGTMDIYTINADGSGLLQLTDNVKGERSPVWSPDRKYIAFIWLGDGQIHIMDSNGKGNRSLTNGFREIISPVWSPDGRRIAFIARENSNSMVWIINTDGTGLKNLSDNNTYSTYPAWSPDGKKIAFVSGTVAGNRVTNNGIVVIDLDGGDVKRLTPNVINPSHPVWSPDGKKILFQVYNGSDPTYSISDPLYSIYIVNPDGTGLTDLTKTLGFGYHPVWSPDGKKIAFLSDKKTLGFDPDQYVTYGLYVMNTDGSGVLKISDSSGYYPSWSPDSKAIAFISETSGKLQLYRVNSDGTTLLALTSLPEFTAIFDAAWSAQYYTSYP